MRKIKRWVALLLMIGLLCSGGIIADKDIAEAAASSSVWVKDSTGWKYIDKNGISVKNKWKKIGGKWYHFDENGYMQTDFQRIDGERYYFGTNGVMRTGWKKITRNGSTFWYYFGGNGVIRTGMQKIGGKQYFFNNSGMMLYDRWVVVDKKNYYFGSNGVMYTGKKTIGGRVFVFGNDGVLIEEIEQEIKDLSSAKVGDRVRFGKYEQDNNRSNGKEPIVWWVADKQGDKLFLISEYALDVQPYNKTRTDCTWETCTLRSWLNKDFKKAAFSNSELKKIQVTHLENQDNPDRLHVILGGNDTDDMIFIPDLRQLIFFKQFNYMVNDEYFFDRFHEGCNATAYAKSRGLKTYKWNESESEAKKKFDGRTYWWLREPGFFQTFAQCIGVDTNSLVGYAVDQLLGVRPAIWIKP